MIAAMPQRIEPGQPGLLPSQGFALPANGPHTISGDQCACTTLPVVPDLQGRAWPVSLAISAICQEDGGRKRTRLQKQVRLRRRYPTYPRL